MLGTCKEIVCLMCDMAQEGMEKARIKAQQNRIKEIIASDSRQLESVYAKIGRMAVLGKEDEKTAELKAEAKRIEARILRAEIRYEMLKDAASVDECTKAFEDKLNDTLDSLKDYTSEKAKEIKDVAAATGESLKEKLKGASSDLTAMAEDVSLKAMDKAAQFSAKAKEKSNAVKAKAGSAAASIKEKLPQNAPEAAKEEMALDEAAVEATEDILKQIEDTLKSVDAGEDSAEDGSNPEEIGEEFKF